MKTTPKPFAEILVPLDGTECAWKALEQAIIIARLEERESRLNLLIVEDQHHPPADVKADDKPLTVALVEWANRVEEEAQRRCEEAAIPARTVRRAGHPQEWILHFEAEHDLTVLHPDEYATHPRGLLATPLETIIREAHHPLLLCADEPSPFDRPVVAYDGHPNSLTALKLAAEIAQRWHETVWVVTVREKDEDPEAVRVTLNEAALLLADAHIQAEFVLLEGDPAEAILEFMDRDVFDALILGGFERPLLVEKLLGGALVKLLKQRRYPLLITPRPA